MTNMDTSRLQHLIDTSWLLTADQRARWTEQLPGMSQEQQETLLSILEKGEEIDKEAAIIACESFAERTEALVAHAQSLVQDA